MTLDSTTGSNGLWKSQEIPYIVVWIRLLLDTWSTWKQLNTVFWKVPTFLKRIPICLPLRTLVKLRWEGETEEVLCHIQEHMVEL